MHLVGLLSSHLTTLVIDRVQVAVGLRIYKCWEILISGSNIIKDTYCQKPECWWHELRKRTWVIFINTSVRTPSLTKVISLVLRTHHIDLFQVDRKGRWRFALCPVPKVSVHLPSLQRYEIINNYVCKTGVVFGKIVVRMRKFPFSFRLRTLCAYLLRSRNTSTININVILFPLKFSVRIVIATRTAECCLLFVYLAQQPPLGHGLLVHEVPRSHTTTHDTR